jgi:nicotinate-nucleotide pyrophosphorylase (carboxylating)
MDRKQLTLQLIRLALEEDRVLDDVTTNSLQQWDRDVTARVTAKADGIISGTFIFAAVFNEVDPSVRLNIFKEDSSPVSRGDVVLEIQGKESSILKAERTALNFLQRLSGIATLTGQLVEKLKPYDITLLDTRKTTPGMRYLEKKAVLDGGGSNHRMNLEDMAMIKDNHIMMAGSITGAVQAIRIAHPGKKIETEVKNLEELKEALSLDVDIIMLDNFSPDQLKEAVQCRNRHNRNNRHTGRQAKLEVSGNVDLENISQKAAAAPGIDYISSGALTHSFKSLDLSLLIEDPQ